MRPPLLLRVVVVATLAGVPIACSARPEAKGNAQAELGERSQTAGQTSCDSSNGGITLPADYCATVFADELGRARHLVVSERGDVYVNTSTNGPGGFIVALRDSDGDGRADLVNRFGSMYEPGRTSGGTGIAIHKGGLYVEVGDQVVRYDLTGGALVPAGAPDVVLSGLPVEGDHRTHSFAVARDGALFVNSGSMTNACQVNNRTLESPGATSCPELDIHAGIWRYDARRTNQVFSPRERFATGMRNTVGLAVEPGEGQLYAVVHGRDQLHENWPRLYSSAQNNEQPAETLVRVAQGRDFGWPTCYFDAARTEYMLAPEYGGDGTTIGPCAGKERPLVTFPAHWAPEAIAFASAAAWPDRYRGGAFVSFHGSWNREPAQAGFLIAFVPFIKGRPTGRYEEFATGFAGAALPVDPATAVYRPVGVAAGRDGSLFVSDDVTGRIWRIVPIR